MLSDSQPQITARLSMDDTKATGPDSETVKELTPAPTILVTSDPEKGAASEDAGPPDGGLAAWLVVFGVSKPFMSSSSEHDRRSSDMISDVYSASVGAFRHSALVRATLTHDLRQCADCQPVPLCSECFRRLPIVLRGRHPRRHSIYHRLDRLPSGRS